MDSTRLTLENAFVPCGIIRLPIMAKGDARNLNIREVRFCKAYAEHGNATQSYIDAGFHHKSRQDACTKAFRMLRKEHIQKYIHELRDRAATAADVDAELIVVQLRNIMLADRRDLYREDGSLKPMSEWPAHLASIVNEVETAETPLGGVVKKIRTVRREQAISLLMKWLGMDQPKEEEVKTDSDNHVIELPPKEKL